MEQSTRTNRGIVIWEEAMKLTEIELEVVAFMEELRLARIRTDPLPEPRFMARRRLPYRWGSKRRRSGIERIPSPPRIGGGSPSTSPEEAKIVDAADSPATTLEFPPSESDEKVSTSKPVKTVTGSKKIEDLQKLCDSLSSQKQALLQEIAKGRSFREKLKEEQSILLKEKFRVEEEKKKHERLCSESKPPATSLNLDSTSAQATVSNQDHHLPLIVDRSSSMKVGLFDLNVAPAEEAVEMAATAKRNRLERKLKIQAKNKFKFRAVNLMR